MSPVPVLPRLALIGAVLSAGCGHPATEDECKTLFDKSVEVEMRELAKAEDMLIAKKKAELRAAPDYETDLKSCVGKRVTDRTMDCVRRASTKAELVDCSH